MLRTNPNIRYEPQERCPTGLALISALQIFVPNTISMVVLLTLIARASGHPDNNLGWIIFMGLLICGVSMIVQTLRLPYLGLGGLVVTNFNVPFMAISTLALAKGGPGLLASLLVASMLLQVLVTLRFASFRRIFTPTVSGTVVMLVAISAVPFIVENAFARVSDAPLWHSVAPGLVALVTGILVSLRAPLAWRLWVLPITVAAGVAVAVPLGQYDVDLLIAAPWVALPGMNWPGFDLSFGADFWTLLPAFLFINLTAFVKAVGDLSVIRRASYRTVGALDIKSIQGGLSVYGAGTLLSGLLGTLPVASPWSISAVYIGFTGIASQTVGIFLGLLTVAAAPLFKMIALLIAIPSPVVSAVYVILFGLLFIEGAKTVFDGSAVDNKKAVITGVSLVFGISSGGMAGLIGGVGADLISSAVNVGGVTAILMTVFVELTGNFRRRRVRAEMGPDAFRSVEGMLREFASRNSWTEEAANRLLLVGEETLLSLSSPDDGAAFPSTESGDGRRLLATIAPDGETAELEILAYSTPANGSNIEDRIAYMESLTPETEGAISLRILQHYASSVNHRSYYGIDVITVRVDK